MIRVHVGDDHVARVTLDRPEAKNALSVQMRDDLVAAVRRARADTDVRALLITPPSLLAVLRAGWQPLVQDLLRLDGMDDADLGVTTASATDRP